MKKHGSKKRSPKIWKLLLPSLKLGVVFALTASTLSQEIPTGWGLPAALLLTKEKSESRVTLLKNCEKKQVICLAY